MKEPKIRFKGFDCTWMQTTWGKLTSNFKYGINAAAIPYDGQNKYLRITDIDDTTRVFMQDSLTTPGIDLTYCNEYIMQDGDIVIARTGASVGKSYIYHKNDGKVYFAGFLIRMRLNDDVDKDFVFQNTLTDSYGKHIKIVSQRSGQPGVNVDELKSYTLSMPLNKDEQQSLGSYFQHLDSLIQSTIKKIESLKQVKAASLQSMFPQEGETKPRVRFKGFEGEWEKVAIKDIATINPKTNIPNIFEYVDLESVVGTELKSHRTETKQTAPSRAQRLASNGDIFYQTVRPYQKNNFYFDLNEDNFVFSSGYAQIRANLCGSFLFALMQQNSFVLKVMDNCTGTSFPAINANVLGTLEIMVTKNIVEQTAIASYFTNLDKQITLQTQRLEKLKQIKSACLDNMFV